MIASFAGSQLEKLLDSQTLATIILALWCALGCAAAIAAIVDAYVKPEGERLSLATTIAATIFAILALAVIAGVVAGAADLGQGDERNGSAELLASSSRVNSGVAIANAPMPIPPVATARQRSA